MKNNITEMVFILDRSGSMSGLESDTIGGFNSMIGSQKKLEGKAYVTTVLFNDRSRTLHDRVELEKVEPLTDKDYCPCGCTALIDALGDTIEHISEIHKYIRREDVPDRTIFVITTDGLENASNRHSADGVRKLIERKKETGWEFIFLGANIDAVETARRYGIDRDHAVEFTCDREGTYINYRAMDKAVSAYRSCGSVQADWKEEVEEYNRK